MLTVAICTWNRAQSLRLALDSFVHARPPTRSEWELVVVDNNSVDETRDVVREFTHRLPIRSVMEPCPGLSNARNAAVREARGHFVLWTDDDVIVDPDWIRAYERALLRHPSATFFGGPAIPLFLGTPPRWLSRHWKAMSEAYAHLDLGAEEITLTSTALPFGLNFGMQTAFMRKYAFDPNVGRNQGNILLHGDETHVLSRAANLGLEGYWVPDARVQHRIPKERQTFAYVYRYYEGHGYTDFLNAAETVRCSMAESFPRWVFRLAGVEFAKCLAGRLRGNGSDWVTHYRRGAYWMGQARAVIDHRKSSGRRALSHR